ncbi:hypothetical protein [Geotalea sp. SG265]|uniref:hypothetical protein n=1 Tax=Geotalea sp. SG265 TaxID=2922867 RepID=UPI001FAF944A|nr:hypothetical protein [Geotalea sp. SG265]
MGKSTDETGPVTPHPTDRIRNEIRSTEAGITETLQTIEQRFTPSHIKAEAKVKLREYSLTGLVKVTETVRKKPVPAALIGVGALWLLFRKKKKHRNKAELPGAALMEALPRKVKKDPVKTMKHYFSLLRIAIAAGTAARAVYLQSKSQRGPAAPGRATVTEVPRAGAFPETVRESVY